MSRESNELEERARGKARARAGGGVIPTVLHGWYRSWKAFRGCVRAVNFDMGGGGGGLKGGAFVASFFCPRLIFTPLCVVSLGWLQVIPDSHRKLPILSDHVIHILFVPFPPSRFFTFLPIPDLNSRFD